MWGFAESIHHIPQNTSVVGLALARLRGMLPSVATVQWQPACLTVYFLQCVQLTNLVIAI